MDNNRRFVLKTLASSSMALAGLSACTNNTLTDILVTDAAPVDDWLQAQIIRDSIIVPKFPEKEFNIEAFGAINDGKFDCTSAINDAIKACHQAGGGKVIIPEGKFFTGAIHLLSNVNLHLADKAILSFSTDPNHYLPAVFTRWEGVEMMGYSPLIYAYKQKNIAITGNGTLEGNANNHTWWPWKGAHKEAHWQLIAGEDQKPARTQLIQDAEDNVPVQDRKYSEGAFLRPPFIQPYLCENVLVEGITIKNSPFWLLNPVLCKHVRVTGVTFLSHGPNSDGFDPESCDHVYIDNCLFDTGDDCIAIKSGRNADGRRIATPCENIVIENCHMKEGHGGVVIGSEISGGVNNVFVQNCTMDSPYLERAIRIKTNSIRGGLIEHIRVRNIDVGTVKNAIVVNFFYEEGDKGKFDPTVRDIKIEKLHCKNVLDKALYLRGFERAPMYDIHLIDCKFDAVAKPSIVEHVKNFTLTAVFINGKEISNNT